MPASPDSPLSASGLGRDYGQHTILRDVSFNVPEGSLCALLGPNGAGKTTLLKLLGGLIAPTHGTAHLLGECCWLANASALRRTGCHLDRFEPPPTTRLSHLLDLSQAIGPKFDRQRAIRLLESRDLTLRQRWRTLSKGQKHWSLLTALLCRGCDVLLLDEPADGLDAESRLQLYQLIRQESNNRQLTALIATHIITDIERVADQVCILHQNTIQLQADLDDLRDQICVIDCDVPPPLNQLPEGLELLHQRQGEIVQLWLRDHCNALDLWTVPHELGRRKVGLQELFIALTEQINPTSRTSDIGTPAMSSA
jgi:ABC-2 type transport system ATP-binding protein